MPSEDEVGALLAEDDRRLAALSDDFDPVSGRGAPGKRREVDIQGWPLGRQWLPEPMLGERLVRAVVRAGGVDAFLERKGAPATAASRARVVEALTRLRCRHDFAFWCATFIYVKNKDGGEDTRFRLTRPQRRLVEAFEVMRLAGKPIRLILLKARQWGGSTATQVYMAWIQLTQRTGLNSLIVAHVKGASANIKSMFDRLVSRYPARMLHPLGSAYNEHEPKMTGVGQSTSDNRIPSRNCQITIGTMENPDAVRSGDYALVHCSEVGLWRTTAGKSPEQVVRSACSGVMLRPLTMIVYESTANGTNNFFHREWQAARQGRSQFATLFVPWHGIERYTAPFATEGEREEFAGRLLRRRSLEDAGDERSEPGRYLWGLWERGCTLEAVNWYVQERRKFNSHADMASEYPTDDVEAFAHSGASVFDPYRVEALRGTVRPARWTGDVTADRDDCCDNPRMALGAEGPLKVWAMPELDAAHPVADRYLAVVDIGGRSAKADWSVVVVFDRLAMLEGGRPSVAAQWRGHVDMDLLAWKAAQLARLYGEALLVVESNTLETRDRDRRVDGDQAAYILDQMRESYRNLYARAQSPEEIRQGLPRRYGFHTNVATKPMVVSTLVRCVREGLWVERDGECLAELLRYERRPNGSFGAVAGAHDDLLMTRAIGLHVCFNEMPMPRVVDAAAMRPARRMPISEATI